MLGERKFAPTPTHVRRNAVWHCHGRNITPSLTSWLILNCVRKRGQKWPVADREYWRTFWWSYLALQTALTLLCFLGSLQSSGNEDVPVFFGIMALTIWGSAFTATPLLSLGAGGDITRVAEISRRKKLMIPPAELPHPFSTQQPSISNAQSDQSIRCGGGRAFSPPGARNTH